MVWVVRVSGGGGMAAAAGAAPGGGDEEAAAAGDTASHTQPALATELPSALRAGSNLGGAPR